MVLQEHADLMVSHHGAGTFTRQVTMKCLDPCQQGIRSDIDPNRKSLAVQPAQPPQQVRYPRPATKRFEEQQFVVKDMRRTGIVRPQDDLADFLVRAESAVCPASGGAKDEHPLHIPGHGHKAPLAADTVDPAQQKLAEAQH